ncbi:MAG: hypothetical protein HOJ25_00085, partial [Candidatus Magasanikbacteria bacterium]|nr:hypothetical protein [Candidatus Magasanikbacteria bacterium]
LLMRLIRFALPILLFSLLVFPSGVFAKPSPPEPPLPSVNIIEKLKTAIDATGKDYKEDLKKHKDPATFIGNVLKVVLTILNTVFFILMIYAGILWMTAKGDETQAKKARDTIIAAVIGVILVLASYGIVRFIFDQSGIATSDECRKHNTGEETGFACKYYTECSKANTMKLSEDKKTLTGCGGPDCYPKECSGVAEIVCCK